MSTRYYNPALGRFINADALAATGQGLLGNNMFAYCNNNPVMHSDPSGETLLSAMIGGAIGGALISVVSHVTTNPNATVGSTLIALTIGAATGAVGGAANVLEAAKLGLSLVAGGIAGFYAGITSTGSTGQKIATGIATAALTTASTYACASIKIPEYTTQFADAAANYSTTVLVGSIAEPVIVATQQGIANYNQPSGSNDRWDWARRKQSDLLGI